MILSAVQKDSSLAPEWITTVNVDIPLLELITLLILLRGLDVSLVMDSRCRHIIISEFVSYLSLTLLPSTAYADLNPKQNLYGRLYLGESRILFKD